MRVFIAEKPSVGFSIAEHFLGRPITKEERQGKTSFTVGQDVVTWCFGHIYELQEPEEYNPAFKVWKNSDLPIFPEILILRPKEDHKAQIKVIKELISKASIVINAGDPDREGQLLIDEVLEELKCKKKVLRITLSATDEKSILKAMSEMEDNSLPKFKNLSESARARSWGDWYVGMNATRKLTLFGQKAGVKGVLSVGRVQTPTLALVVARDAAIDGFVPKAFYQVKATIEADGKTFHARWIPGEAVTLDEAKRLIDKNVAETIVEKLSGSLVKVEKCDTKNQVENQPLPFSLDTLQIACNRILGFSLQKTLDVAQKLYEKKVSTYPRTDCGYLPENQFMDAERILKSLSGRYPTEIAKADFSIKSNAWNDSKVTAHHGIMPTGIMENLSEDEDKVFDLIARQTIAQFYPSAKNLETSLEMSCAGESLAVKGKIIVDLGWKVLYKKDVETDEPIDSEDAVTLPNLKVGSEAVCKEAALESKKTTSPKRFTEASLLAAMLSIHQFEEEPSIRAQLKETSGLGTPATRAKILETLKNRGFIEVSKKNIVSTPIGRQVIATLPVYLKSPGLTAIFESKLDEIASGKITKEVFIEKIKGIVSLFIGSTLDLSHLAKVGGPPEPKKKSVRRKAKAIRSI